MEKMAKKIEVRLDANESFTKVNKNRNLHNAMRIQMMDLDFIVSWCANPQPGGVMHPPKPRG